MSEDPIPYHPDGAPAKPAQPSIADLYAEIAALRKERDALRLEVDAVLNRAKAEAFDPKAPSIHDRKAVLTATSRGITVRANCEGWIAFGADGLIASGPENEPLAFMREAAPYANFQAAVVNLASVGIHLGEPSLDSSCNPTTTPIPTPA